MEKIGESVSIPEYNYKMEDILRVGTTFSGIGAPEQALKNLGIPFVTKWACDICKDAKATYFANHQCEKWYDDIAKIDIDGLEPVDLYVFGFPCQDCSINGKKDLEKGRTALVKYSLDIIEKLRPKHFLFENVKGLLSKKFESFFNEILESLGKNYNLQFQLLNSKDFGVAQSRDRIYCVGIRNDAEQEFEFPVGKETELRLRDIFENGESDLPIDHKFYRFPFTETKNYRQYDRSGKGYKSQADRIYFPHSLAPTLPAFGNGIPSTLLPNGKIRYLTTLERVRLQGFPDNFNFPVSERNSWKQLGNTITVPVLEAIFKNLL